MTRRHLDAPARRQTEVGKNLRTPFTQMFNMKRLKKVGFLAECVIPPHVPTASACFGRMAKSIKRQLAVRLESDTDLTPWHRQIKLGAKPGAHVLLFNRNVVHVCLTLRLRSDSPRALRAGPYVFLKPLVRR
jgi:hypothetical protein